MCNAFECFLQFEHFTDCSVREYRSILDEFKLSILKHLPIMLALRQHNTLAYYAFYYAGIFDAGLVQNNLVPNTCTLFAAAQIQHGQRYKSKVHVYRW